MINYACIKSNVVENILVFQENNSELIQQVKEAFSYDEMVNCPIDLLVNVEYLYDGTYFYRSEGVKAMYSDGCEHGEPEHINSEHRQSEQGDGLEV